jgi:BirA family transcriptional regulator, biotin operon repressor / biotin---[acetyl-CoA-carboxylase] ligase
MPQVIRLPTVDSTMDLLHGLAAEGAGAGTVVVAGEQTGGRGSRGRGWRSPSGGLWLSLLLRPSSAVGIELLGLRIGLAVTEALAALSPGVPVEIKWPNDLMLDDRKLGGILCEARWQGESLAWVVAGVGINVANPIPPELAGMAISLAEQLPGITPQVIEPALTARLRALDAPAERLRLSELKALRQRDWLYGRPLLAPEPGIAQGIADDGALLVRRTEGEIVPVRAGTVKLADRSLTP